jgi:hypothetical protein
MSPYVAGGIGLFYIATCLGCIYAGYEYRDARCQAADNATVAKAEERAVSVVQQQGNISKEASNAFSQKITTIRNLYGVTGLQPATPDGMPGLSKPTSGIRPVQRQRSKVYGLTYQQCDQEEAKANALWNWSNQQAQVK